MKKKVNFYNFFIMYLVKIKKITNFRQIIGSVTGAYLGSKVGSGVGKDISMVLGTALG